MAIFVKASRRAKAYVRSTSGRLRRLARDANYKKSNHKKYLLSYNKAILSDPKISVNKRRAVKSTLKALRGAAYKHY